MNRHRHHVVDADLAVVLVEERRAAEGAVGQAILDALGRGGGVAAVLAHQRVDVEEAVEDLDLAARDRSGEVADDRAAPAVEIARREGGEVGSDQAREVLDPAAREVLGTAAARADRVQRVERLAQLAAGQWFHVVPLRFELGPKMRRQLTN